MTLPLEPDLEKRVANIETALASMQRSLDALSRTRASYSEPRAAPVSRPRIPAAHAPSRTHSVETDPAGWIAGRTPEWWVGALGTLFLIIALFLLYKYAVDHNWITPLIRVLTGVVVGAGLVTAGVRLTVPKPAGSNDHVGLREILLGGGIAAWYISSYAAAVYYQLISIPSARVCFLALSVTAACLALKERRLVFALIAVGVGFAAPFLLPSPPHGVIGLSLYLAPLCCVGLVLYLMRGWQSVLWTSFIGFWVGLQVYQLDDFRFFPSTGISVVRVVMTLMILAFGAAFTRVPIMRRRLLATGSALYTPSTMPDAPAVWLITIATPMLVLGLLSWTWPQVASQFWGILGLAFGIEAYRLSLVENQAHAETPQIESTAAVLWTLAGSFGIIPSFYPRFVSDIGPVFLGVAALHASLGLYLLGRGRTAARAMSKVTFLLSFATVVIYELQHFSGMSIEWNWVSAEVIVLAVGAWFWKVLSRDPAEELESVAVAVAGYATLLLVLARVLGFIWPPLVSMSFALAGVSLLLASRQGSSRGLLLKLGGLTMVVVVGRLLIVDLSAVATIWRVVLFLACGTIFVYTSYRLQPGKGLGKAT